MARNASERSYRRRPPGRQDGRVIHPSVHERRDQLRGGFDKALPFPHVVIDDFFCTGAAEQLLAEFPAFDPVNAINEFDPVSFSSSRERAAILRAADAST